MSSSTTTLLRQRQSDITLTGNMAPYKLVKWADNWADEMDLDGFKLMTNEEYDAYIAGWKKAFEYKGSYTMCVGTNEDIEYDSFEQFESTLEVNALENGEYRTIIEHLGETYGFFPDVPDDDMIEAFGGSSDEDD